LAEVDLLAIAIDPHGALFGGNLDGKLLEKTVGSQVERGSIGFSEQVGL
jgi:hypothetical protein